MGIVEQVLAEFEASSGHDYRVEYNEGGDIHLHTEHVRIDFTPEEFRTFAETVVESRAALEETKAGEPAD